MRIGALFEPDDKLPVARLLRGGEDLVTQAMGPRSACCDARLEDDTWETMTCTKCHKQHVRVGIEYVPK